jgi:CheY-like chemotaxis protein
MDGLDTTRRIRELEETRSIHHHIIGLTAHAQTSVRDQCLDAGMDDYISKPINFDFLARKLNPASKAA